MTEQYQVTIQGQLGPREGVLTLSYQESYCAEHLPQNPPRCGGKAHFSIKDPGRRRNCEQGNGKVILF